MIFLNKFVLLSVRINGDLVVYCFHGHLDQVLFFLKNHTMTRFRSVIDMVATDFISFLEINYCLLSVQFSKRIRVKSILSNNAGTGVSLDSSASVFRASSWLERECWDMFGIYFKNHADLRRILTDYGFNGHPLKKKFPLSGYVEVRYSSNKKRVVLEPLELSQEFRMFDFASPWLSI
jgi:NADH:ubiquinone oxidoreductase subunit C